MKLAIVAATGKVGRHVLEQAVAARYDVTAVVRSPDKLTHRVRTVAMDLGAADPARLESAFVGVDAVLSCLGPESNRQAGVAAAGTRAIVAAMRVAGVRRIVAISASPLSTMRTPDRPSQPRHDPGEGFVIRNLATPIIKVVFRKAYTDLASMEDILRDSDLDWTVIRPPRLIDRPMTGTYRTALGQNLRRGVTIARADVAHLMLRALAMPETTRQHVGVAY